MTQKTTDTTEGWESHSEEAGGGSLASNPELEEALREAAEAIEKREEKSEDGALSSLDLTEPPDDAPSQEVVEDLSAEVVDLKDRLLRLQAEFDNFRKRALRERQEALQYGHQNLTGLLRGVELVQRELLGALGNHGVTRVEALGKAFDPTLHEAMAQAPDGSVPENTVLEVFEEGYQLRDRLIRPARVVVAKAPEGEGS